MHAKGTSQRLKQSVDCKASFSCISLISLGLKPLLECQFRDFSFSVVLLYFELWVYAGKKISSGSLRNIFFLFLNLIYESGFAIVISQLQRALQSELLLSAGSPSFGFMLCAGNSAHLQGVGPGGQTSPSVSRPHGACIRRPWQPQWVATHRTGFLWTQGATHRGNYTSPRCRGEGYPAVRSPRAEQCGQPAAGHPDSTASSCSPVGAVPLPWQQRWALGSCLRQRFFHWGWVQMAVL